MTAPSPRVSPAEIVEIQRKAEAATPGQWYHRQAEPVRGGDLSWIADAPHGGLHDKIIVGRFATYGGAVDYAHIASVCPATTIALCLDAADRDAEIARQAAEIAALRGELAEWEVAGWRAGRNAAYTIAVEYRDEQAELAIDTDDDETSRLRAARAVAGNTIRSRIAALTPPTAPQPAADPPGMGDTDILGTTYDGVEVLKPVTASTRFTPEEARDMVRTAMGMPGGEPKEGT